MNESIELNEDFVEWVEFIYKKCLNSEKEVIQESFNSIGITPREFYNILKDAVITVNGNITFDLTNEGFVEFFNALEKNDYSEETINKINQGVQLIPNLIQIIVMTTEREFGVNIEEEINQKTLEALDRQNLNFSKRFNIPLAEVESENILQSTLSNRTVIKGKYEDIDISNFESSNDKKTALLSKLVYKKKLTISEMAFESALIKVEKTEWLGDLHTWSYLMKEIKLKCKFIQKKGKKGFYSTAIPLFDFCNSEETNVTSKKISDYAFKIEQSVHKHEKAKAKVSAIVNNVLQ